MSKEATSEAAAPAEAPKKSKMPMIVMAVGLLSLAGAGAVVFLGLGHSKAATKAPKGEHGDEHEAPGDEHEEDAESDGHASPAGGFNHKLDSFIANLTSDDGELHYIKCTLTLELKDEKAVAQLDKKLPRVRQDVLLYLSGLTMASTSGGEAKRKVREGLDATVKAAAGKLVKNVYVVEMVVQ